jgi:hypothetical protein
LDHLLPGGENEGGDALHQRLQGLAKFQEAALRHAFCLPSLQRLAYSTCSIHQEENEDVVAAVMPLATKLGFRLVDPLPGWHRRGLPVLDGSELLVRVDEVLDRTDGFFIAVFEKQEQGLQVNGGGCGTELIGGTAGGTRSPGCNEEVSCVDEQRRKKESPARSKARKRRRDEEGKLSRKSRTLGEKCHGVSKEKGP